MTVTNTAIPVISGTAQQGQTLSTTNGSWTFDLDYLSYAYQWLRCDAAGANCVPIFGATAQTYLLTSYDVGSTVRSEVTATEHASTGTPYLDIDFSANLYSGEGVMTVFEAYQSDSRLQVWGGLSSACYDAPGSCGLSPTTSMSTDQNQRVHLISSLTDDPNNGSNYASWQELRRTDGAWASNTPTLAKATLNINDSGNQNLTWGPSGFQWGIERWFAHDVFFPLNIGGVSFELQSQWTVYWDLHPASSSGTGHFDCHIAPLYSSSTNNRSYALRHALSDSSPSDITTLVPLWDGSGNRIGANFNTWHEVVIGMKTSNPNTQGANPGWVEIWVDGSQVLAQTARAMFPSTETHPYLQLQNYSPHPPPIIGGATKTAIVYGGLRAGLTRADVQRM